MTFHLGKPPDWTAASPRVTMVYLINGQLGTQGSHNLVVVKDASGIITFGQEGLPGRGCKVHVHQYFLQYVGER